MIHTNPLHRVKHCIPVEGKQVTIYTGHSGVPFIAFRHGRQWRMYCEIGNRYVVMFTKIHKRDHWRYGDHHREDICRTDGYIDGDLEEGDFLGPELKIHYSSDVAEMGSAPPEFKFSLSSLIGEDEG